MNRLDLDPLRADRAIPCVCSVLLRLVSQRSERATARWAHPAGALDEPRGRAAQPDRRHAPFADGLRAHRRWLEAGRSGVVVDDAAFGYPVRSLKDVPPERIHAAGRAQQVRDLSPQRRQDGEDAPGPGRGSALERIASGNLYSKPRKITLTRGGASIPVSLTEVIPPIPTPADTKYIRHIKMQSDVLTEVLGQADVCERSRAGARRI